jgi:riboflavin kinase/FMN adenylyltransferase
MIVLRDSSPIPPAARGAVVALGNFDGLHLGHTAVIGKALGVARAAKAPAMVMTFEPHPRQVFMLSPPLNILPLSEKLHGLAAMGVDYLRILRFTRDFSQTRAEVFVEGILHKGLSISHVVTGEDFTFGRNRGGNVAFLHDIADKLGFAATVCPPVSVAGGRCSSTRIREHLSRGEMVQAGMLLGRPYVIPGRVREGDKRGRGLGFPTANILPAPRFLPAYGIYAVKVRLKGQQVKGVANLGIRPNYPLKRPLLEVHLFDWQESIYGEHIEVEPVHYLRPEQKFADEEGLKRQMEQDALKAKRFLAGA